MNAANTTLDAPGDRRRPAASAASVAIAARASRAIFALHASLASLAMPATLAGLGGLAAPLLAHAAADPLEDMIACSEIAAPRDRLACYDTAIRALRATETPDDRSPAAAGQRGGVTARGDGSSASRGEATAPRAGDGREDAGKEGDVRPPSAHERHGIVIETTLEKVDRDGFRRYLLHLANGQLWRQIGSGAYAGVRPGAQVTIRRSAYGGFHARFDGLAREMYVEQIR